MNKSLLVLLSFAFYSYHSLSSDFLTKNFDFQDHKILTNRKSSELYPYESLYSQIVPHLPLPSSQVIVKIALYLSPFDVHNLKQVSKHFRETINNHHYLLNRQYLQTHYFDGHNNKAIQQNFKPNLSICIELSQQSSVFSQQPLKSWREEFLDVRLGALLAPYCVTWKRLRLYFNYIDFIKDKKLLGIDRLNEKLTSWPSHSDCDFIQAEELKKLDHVEKLRDQLKNLTHDKTLTIFIESEKRFYQMILKKALELIEAQPHHQSLINPYWKFQLLYYQGKGQEAITYIAKINNCLENDPQILYLKFKQGLALKDKTQSGAILLQLAHMDYTQWRQDALKRTFSMEAMETEARRTYIDSYIDNCQNKIAKAQYFMGQLSHQGYYKGFHTPQNLIRALEWYKQAADNGHAQAQSTLYTLYLHRYKILLAPQKTHLINVTQHYIEVLENNVQQWLQAAADQGIAAAQYNYAMQNFLSKRYNTAKRWFKLAAAQDYTKAFYKLGQIYEVEDDTPLHQNAIALWWYDQAALHDHKDAQFKMRLAYNYKVAKKLDYDVSLVSNAQYELGVLYSHGDKLLQANPMLAYFYLSSSANLGNAMALYELGSWYEKGYYVNEDVQQSSSLYKRSANLGFSGALCKKAQMYQRSQDKKIALEIYKKIKPHHDPRYQYYHAKAAYKLSKLYSADSQGQKDNFGAEFHLYKAAVSGYPKAQYNFLIKHFVTNQQGGYPQYGSNIFRKLYASAVNRNRKACFYLGQVYNRGIGIKQNVQRAAKWYLKSSQQGYHRALSHLQALYDDGIIVKVFDDILPDDVMKRLIGTD